MLNKLNNKEYAYNNEYAIYTNFFKQKKNLHKYLNPMNLTKLLKIEEEFVPKNINKINKDVVYINNLKSLIKKNYEKLLYWNS